MSEKINLGRTGFVTKAYKNTIDTNFTQLTPPPPPVEEVISVEEFFNLYTNLFYEIPAEGDVNSHQFLIERSTEYIGFTEEKDQDIEALLNEITQLREELLATQEELRTAQTGDSSQTQNQSTSLQEGTQITSNPFSLPSSIVN